MRNILSGCLAVLAAALMCRPATAQADAPGSAFHGFGFAQVSNDYITPRGLLVTNEGVTGQFLAGLVLVLPANFSVVAGSWNDVDALHQHDPGVGAWVEEDFFAGVNYQVTKQLKLSVTYDSWNFPSGSPSNEQNIEFTAAYDDSRPGVAFSLQPHATVFWAVASPSSDVVVGRPANSGTTAYLELGVTPTYSLKSVPVTFTMPTWFSVGPPEFWCDSNSGSAEAAAAIKGRSCGRNDFGVFSTGLTATMPLSFVPKQYGSWHVYAGAQYFNLLNGALVDAQALTIGSTNGHRNVVNGMAGFGFNF